MLTERPSREKRLESVALADAGGQWTYGELLRQADHFRDRFLATAATAAMAGAEPRFSAGPVLAGERIAFLMPPGRTHVAVQWGVWRVGGIAVPLAMSHPPRELEHVLDDAKPRIVVADPSLRHAASLLRAAAARGAWTLEAGAERRPAALAPENRDVVAQDDAPGPSSARGPASDSTWPGLAHCGPSSRVRGPAPGDGALVLYTSGTTGRPKGVLSTHANLAAQCRALVSAWGWSRDDRILHVLPLHHVHGVVNALCCALWSGAMCEFGDPAPVAVWERLASGEITLFMAVPTVYGRLVRAWEAAPPETRRRWSRGARRARLMVSGSAALPVPTLERWREITGHTLLERYGMTEIGMALSNPLAGERRPGGVGQPLPGVQVRLVDDDGRPVAGDSGQLAVRGPQVFKEYWGRPRETAAAFRDGWFLTGDEARLEDGSYRILGRRSVDVLKTGGYKVSALEVEELYRAHPAVRDVAVVGAPDPDWGQRLCAAWTPRSAGREAASELPAARTPPAAAVGTPDSAAGSEACPKPALPSAAELRAWGKQRLAPYKVPHDFLMMDRLPRNAMGKVRKPALVSIFNAGPPGSHRSGQDAPS